MPACVDELVVSAELTSKVSWGDEPPAVVGESMEAFGVARNRADLGLLLAVRSFDCRGEHRAEGHSSVVGWLRHHLRMKKRTAQRIARLSRFVSQHQAVEDGMRAGHLSLDHVEVIADRWAARHAAAWDEAMPLIVELAKSIRFEDLARDLTAFADNLAPNDAEDRFEEQLDGRCFSKAKTIDGYGFLRGWMDPISFEIFAAEHDRITDDLFAQDWAFCQDVLGRDPDENELAELTRCRENRAHDALVEMARRSKTLAGGKVAAAAEVVLHTTQDTYEEALRHLISDDPDDEMTIPPGGFCETADGTPITPVAAVYTSLIGQVRRIVFGADDEILSYGRARRLYSDAQTSALRAKYRRCTHPYGCDHTGRRLQIDHILEHQDGGPTDIDNGQPLDGTHNRWKTNTRGQPPPSDTWIDTNQRRGPPKWC